MILDIILFPAFVCLVYALGAGVLAVFSRGHQDYPLYFYFIAPLLALGFLSVAFNFFTGVATPGYYVIVGLLLALGIFRLRRVPVRAHAIEFLLLGLLLAPLAATMGHGYDATLYHLPHQLWLRDEKIVFGLANMQTRFGFSSILEYISAPLWIGEQFKLLAYGNTIFVLAFLLFLLDMIRSIDRKTALLGVLTAAGIALWSAPFIFGYTSADAPTGMLFAMAYLIGFSMLLQETKVDARGLSLFFLCGLFALLLKPSGALIGIWALFVVAVLLRRGQMRFADLLKASVIPGVLLSLWLIRGVIVSGCLFFPIEASCLDVSWTARASAIETSAGITQWARHPAAGDYSLHSWSWLWKWWLPNNALFMAGMMGFSLALAWGYRFLFQVAGGVAQDRRVLLPALAFALLGLGVWFMKAPTPRFGIGNFIIFMPAAALYAYGFRDMNESVKQKITAVLRPFVSRVRWLATWQPLQIVGVLAVFIIVVKFSGLTFYYSMRKDMLGFDMKTIPVYEAIPGKNFGSMPKDGDNCGLIKYCSPDSPPAMSEENGYKYFRR